MTMQLRRNRGRARRSIGLSSVALGTVMSACELFAPLGPEPVELGGGGKAGEQVASGDGGACADCGGDGGEPSAASGAGGLAGTGNTPESGGGGRAGTAGTHGGGSSGAPASGGRTGVAGSDAGHAGREGGAPNGAGGESAGGGAGDGDAGAAGDSGASSRPSCEALRERCGTQELDCCASTRLPPGVFSLGGQERLENSTATLEAFELDVFEVTVGRFREFLSAYDAWRAEGNPKPARGALPRVDDSGWRAEWDALLPEDRAAFETRLVSCPFFSHSSSPADATRPINCVSWEEAFAFCIWDDARLPTNAEYEYAAFGGDEYREYPWGAGPIDPDHVVYGCLGFGTDECTPDDILPVGSRPLGVGRWGQFDLLGSVYDLVFDYFGTYPEQCDGCALTSGEHRIMRGGAWFAAAGYQHSLRVDYSVDVVRDAAFGLRCARSIEPK